MSVWDYLIFMKCMFVLDEVASKRRRQDSIHSSLGQDLPPSPIDITARKPFTPAKTVSLSELVNIITKGRVN